jgi:hypothetical protein
MVPAPRGAGIVAARVPKKVLQFAGIDDVFTSSRGSTKTLGNFVKVCFLFRTLTYVLFCCFEIGLVMLVSLGKFEVIYCCD